MTEIGLVELEYLEATILHACIVEIKLALPFSFELADNPADTLLADIGNGFVPCLEGFALMCAGFRKLDKDEFAVAVVLFVQIKNGMGGGC